MTPGRASASGFHYSDPYREDGDFCTDDSDPFWGHGTEGEAASVSTCRWGDVAVVQPDAPEFPLSLHSPWHDSSPLSSIPLSPMPAFSELSNSAAWAAAAPGDIRQLLASESEPSPEPAQKLPRKRPHEAEQTEGLAALNEPADRMVEIAGFRWTLPPDPGEGGAYPSLTFLIGAAISSSENDMMTRSGICEWIRARYPSRPESGDVAIAKTLSRQADFIHIRTDVRNKGLWRLHNPQQFRDYYEKDIFLKQRPGIMYRDWALRRVRSQKSSGAASPTLSVKIGGHTLLLPPYSSSHKKAPLKLLCGYAIACGPEKGSDVTEIAEWIAGYYSVQEKEVINRLQGNICSTLNLYKDDFQRTNIRALRRLGRGIDGKKWVLKNPAHFAARYGLRAWEDGAGGGDPPLSTMPLSSRVGSVSESAPLPESPQRLSRKRSRRAGQTAVLPAPKKPVNRTVEIFGFTWTLPPDPGKSGLHPSQTFLIGAAISSSGSGAMTVAGIYQWIKARYPSRTLTSTSIGRLLAKQRTDFICTRTDICDNGLWRLRDPQQFRSYYERDIFLKQRLGVAYRNWALSAIRATSEQGSPAAASPILSVKFGDHILTLPPYSEGQKRPPLRLLCGCAIALGSEQGSSVSEIAGWIANCYSLQGADTMKKWKGNIGTILRGYRNDFRRSGTDVPRVSKRGAAKIRWVLKNPADFAASYGGVPAIRAVSSTVGTRTRSSTPVSSEPQANRQFKEGVMQ